ncbi:MOSC N-terminal beta barrel domain-containing protein [Streptomyces pactum]|uniref:MOSC N-terminal beta barrel domain-containing protein n=1 Tax=Streptomyces pactum TaxID=68249 RepID=A0ABS0NIL2_9ACTN|nr:MOSC N-terminal beta barrel domain-containing protein [Streptomyces pactum]MBH5335038.1 MOSC N-terminal beta barrel domain-containing protein [Streptomyces pactum]
MATVVELLTYPIKGCAGVPLTEAVLTEAGIAHDRSFMVVDGDGVFRSQRGTPRLAVIRPLVGADGDRLTLRAPGTAELTVPIDRESVRRDVTLFGDPYRGIDQGQDAADWLSAVLGVPSRLVRVPPEHDRRTDGLTPGTSGYADSSAVHVISRASLDDVNRRITAAGREPLPMDRFRPNIVLDGWTEPYREDLVRRMGIGETELGYTKLAIRCAVTLVDQDRGTRAGPEPLRTLAGYRRAARGGVAFGAKFAVLRTGGLAVGDEVRVTTWGGSELGEPAPAG